MSWIYENYGKPNRCECGNKRNIQWFSKSGLLKEDRGDWVSLCSRCLKDMRQKQKEYKVSLEELKEKRTEAGKELSDIENKITNNNYDELITQKNKTNKENISLGKENYNFGIEIDKQKIEIEELCKDFKKKEKEKVKKEKQERLELVKIEVATEKELAKRNEVFIKTQKKEIKELSKYIDEFSSTKLNLETEIKDLQENLIEANRIIGQAGEMNKEIENEKNAIDKRNHKADVRERSLIRKYKRLGINITNI